MPKYRVAVRQWVEEIAVKEFEADSKQHARDLAYNYNIIDDDWDWQDGNDIQDFEIASIREVKEE